MNPMSIALSLLDSLSPTRLSLVVISTFPVAAFGRYRASVLFVGAENSRSFEKLPAIRLHAEEHRSIVRIIQDEQVLATLLLIAQPLIHELERINIVLVPARNRQFSRNILVALLESCSVAGIDPQHMCLWIVLSEHVCILDSYLRFANAAEPSHGNISLGLKLLGDLVDDRLPSEEVLRL